MWGRKRAVPDEDRSDIPGGFTSGAAHAPVFPDVQSPTDRNRLRFFVTMRPARPETVIAETGAWPLPHLELMGESRLPPERNERPVSAESRRRPASEG